MLLGWSSSTPYDVVRLVAEVLLRALALLVGVALLLATVSALGMVSGTPSGRGAVLRPVLQLLALSAAWLLVNSPVEGRTLWSPLHGHGLTEADVFVVPPLLLAALLAVLHLPG